MSRFVSFWFFEVKFREDSVTRSNGRPNMAVIVRIGKLKASAGGLDGYMFIFLDHFPVSTVC